MSRIPKVGQPIADWRGEVTQPWRTFLQSLELAGVGDAEIQAIARKLGSPDGSIEGIPESRLEQLSVIGIRSIQAVKLGSTVRVGLRGDDGGHSADSYYGAGPDGSLGFWPLPEPPPPSFVPTRIPTGETFAVPADKQALFALPIDSEGEIVIDGHLIEVS